MSRKRHSDEDILKLLREIEVKLANGSDVQSACRGVGISDATYYNWRKRFGGMGRSQLSEMRSLERENTRLKKIVAASSTICSSLKWSCTSANNASETVAGVKLIASVNSRAARSAGSNRELLRQSDTAAIFASELPAALLPAALESIQNGQVTICAARKHTR